MDKDNKFSYFKGPVTNTGPTKREALPAIYKIIQSDRFKAATERLRALRGKAAANYKKTNFDFVTFCGKFHQAGFRKPCRAVRGCSCSTFDDLPDPESVKTDLILDKHMRLAFTSPSGWD